MLPQLPLPEWMTPAFDERFLEKAREAGYLDEVKAFQKRQNEIEEKLKQVLPREAFQWVLE
ncbi:hypothetical protein [Paenibacillus humicola]|uniref:hypothetical protein n=1 Tax=Paenibacillus humicola TaxID=3110540 RepID=UPI00237B5DF0|nr:hypothetical protein [Paenibacillus humicola]